MLFEIGCKQCLDCTMHSNMHKREWAYTYPAPLTREEKPSKSQSVFSKEKSVMHNMAIDWKSVIGKNCSRCSVRKTGYRRLTGGAGLQLNQHSTEYRQAIITRFEFLQIRAAWEFDWLVRLKNALVMKNRRVLAREIQTRSVAFRYPKDIGTTESALLQRYISQIGKGNSLENYRIVGSNPIYKKRKDALGVM